MRWGSRLLAAVAALGALAWAGGASAAVIETVDVDIADPEGVQTTAVLEDGVEYLVTVSGLVDTYIDKGLLTDADYFSFDNFVTIRDVNKAGVDVGLTIDGALVDWGPFSLDHVYAVSIVGAGAPLLLAFLDTYYADNFGYLHVTISSTDTMLENPVPGAAVLFGTALAAGALRLRKGKKRKAAL